MDNRDDDKTVTTGEPENQEEHKNGFHHVKYISSMYEDWFLDYASYVILERAVPHVHDGLKPVQRRILHAMKKLDDGRYNKVANIIGFTMQFHPHGDASIGSALVNMGQKDLLVDTQGNWGNIYTGDGAAAPRYIEARLSKFALDVVFNHKTTEWKLSYDGRNNEPVTLPVKFPLLLSTGVEGIAVGLASKILPHNFIELIDASIAHLKDEEFVLLPDFQTGGMADFSRYNDGIQGGKVRVRARIEKEDKRTLKITELPYGETTSGLIDSIISANEKGKIKIKKIDDNTAYKVEILIHLPAGVSSDTTIDALYAFTNCEISISPNSCIIQDNKPIFPGVSEMLRVSTDKTRLLLKMELNIRKGELQDLWHKSSLEKIFIENRIYSHIEDCETWESIIETIDKGLDPWKKLLQREVTRDDIVKLTEIKIKRISKYDAFKADEYIKSLEEELGEVQNHLDHLTDYTIAWFKELKKKYSSGKERKTEIRNFDTIEATKVVIANQKLYVDRKEGFYGMGLKKDEFICNCSEIDDIIVFLRNGKYMVSKVSDKSFAGKDILHIDVFRKNDARTVYNVAYQDGKRGKSYIKRFNVTAVTRDKVYDLTKGTEGSKILYFSANPNGEAEKIRVTLKPTPRMRKLGFDFDFGDLGIKGRGSMGNQLSKHEVYKVVMKEKGVSTLGGRNIWFDWDVKRLNAEERGDFLGEFSGDEKILVVTETGEFRLFSFELTNHFPDNIKIIRKFDPSLICSVVYYDGEKEFFYIKRFNFEDTDRLQSFVGENEDSKLIHMSLHPYPRVAIKFGGKHSARPMEVIDIEDFIAVKGFKARGKRITTFEVESINELEPVKEAVVPEESEEQMSSENISAENGSEESGEEINSLSQLSLPFLNGKKAETTEEENE